MTEVVLDASAIVAMLDGNNRAQMIVTGATTLLASPVIDAEVLSAVRREVLAGRRAVSDLDGAVALLDTLGLERASTHDLNVRIAELHANVTPFDATYVALAELLAIPLVTADARLSRAPGPRCEFIVC